MRHRGRTQRLATPAVAVRIPADPRPCVRPGTAVAVTLVGLVALGVAAASAQPRGQSQMVAQAPAAPSSPGGAKALFYGSSGATLRPDAARQGAAAGRPLPLPPQAPATAPGEYMGVTYWVELVEPNGQQRRVTADHVFRSGDRIRLSVQSNRDGALALINLGSTGRATPLFPAAGQEASAAIRAHQVYQIPPRGHLRFDHNPGEETLILILSPSPAPGGSAGAAPPMTTALPGGTPPPTPAALPGGMPPPPPAAPPGSPPLPALPALPPTSTALPGAGSPPPPVPSPATDASPPLPQLAGPPPAGAPQAVPATDAPLPFPQPGASSSPSPQPAALPLPAPAADAPLPFPQPAAAATPPAPGNSSPPSIPAPRTPVTAQGPQGAPSRPAGTTQQVTEDLVRVVQEAMRKGAKDLVVETEQGGAQPASYAVAPLASVQGGSMITVQIRLRHQ